MTKKQLLRTIGLSIGGIIAIAGITIAVLMLVRQPSEDTAVVPQTESTPAPKDVVADIYNRVLAASYDGITAGPIDDSVTAPVAVPLAGTEAVATVPGTDGLVFSSPTSLTAAQIEAIRSSLEAALQSQSVNASPASYAQAYTTYANTTITCTLFAPAQAPTASLACLTAENLASAIEMVTTLTGTWLNAPSYSLLAYSSVEKDGAQLALLTAYANEQQVVAGPLFSRQGNEAWTYRADSVASNVEDEMGGGKLATTDELQALQNDATFGPLLNSLLNTTQPTPSQ
jgi:hypothetical protein